MLDDFLEILVNQLAADGAATFRGLGRFETRLSPTRPGRNPATGQPASIPAPRPPAPGLHPEPGTKAAALGPEEPPEAR